MPRISVLMPTHNRADVIGFAINSVLWQTEGDFELLIVGDGCTDNTADVVASFDDPRIKWFDLPKAPYYGYANRNIALRQAAGELIAFAAHDDLLFPDHLERLAAAIDRPGIDWIYSRPLWISTDGVIVPYCTNLHHADELDRFLNVKNTLPASCVMHRRACFDRSGYWPEDVPAAADWRFWIRIITDGGLQSFDYLPVPTTIHFSADWKKSRYSGMNEVKTMLEIADGAPWWPSSLKYGVPEDKAEQGVLYRAMEDGGQEWCSRTRGDVESVIDRLAWDYVQHSYPNSLKQRADLERSQQAAHQQSTKMRTLEQQLHEQSERIRHLNDRQATRDKAAETEVMALKTQIRELNSQQTTKDDAAKSQITALQSRIQQLLDSRSWRVTAPLRRLSTALRRSR